MADFDPTAYAISVQRVTEDGHRLFRATIRELPHVIDYGDTADEAYSLAIESIANLAKMAQEAGRDFPPPLQESDEFSGRVTLRMTKTLHRKAAVKADQEGVSLNAFLLAIIAEGVGSQSVMRPHVLGTSARPTAFFDVSTALSLRAASLRLRRENETNVAEDFDMWPVGSVASTAKEKGFFYSDEILISR